MSETIYAVVLWECVDGCTWNQTAFNIMIDISLDKRAKRGPTCYIMLLPVTGSLLLTGKPKSFDAEIPCRRDPIVANGVGMNYSDYFRKIL